jgi:hypothetical protein
MNGVLHSEHVISRSGIVVSPPKVIEDSHSLALRSAGVAFLSTTGRGAKALFLQTHAEKPWRPDGLLDLSVLQQLGLFKFLNEPELETVAERLHRSSLCGSRATHRSQKLRFLHGIFVARLHH